MLKNVNISSFDNKKEFETRLRQIEKSIEPLIEQITTPTGVFGKNKSTNVYNLVKYLNESILSFQNSSREVLNESGTNIEEHQIASELDSFRMKSSQMIKISNDFSNDPVSTELRLQMIQKARELLISVARILAIADLIDLSELNGLKERVETSLNRMKMSNCKEELMMYFHEYGLNFKELINFIKKALNVNHFFLVTVK